MAISLFTVMLLTVFRAATGSSYVGVGDIKALKVLVLVV